MKGLWNVALGMAIMTIAVVGWMRGSALAAFMFTVGFAFVATGVIQLHEKEKK